MLNIPSHVRVYVCTMATDMRKSFDGLHALVRQVFKSDPLDGHLFLFRNRRGDRVKIMEFDRPRLWVRRIEYPKYKIPSLPQLNIVQGERAPSLIPGGSFGFGIGAEVLFNKFALHIPLYRQQDPFAQLGWAPNRSTLCQIVANSAELLRPLAMLETKRVLSSLVINTDDTEVTLLTPGQGKGSRKARLWIYRSNEEQAKYDAFAFTNSRARAGPDEFLQDFHGTICGDCYSGYVNIDTIWMCGLTSVTYWNDSPKAKTTWKSCCRTRGRPSRRNDPRKSKRTKPERRPVT